MNDVVVDASVVLRWAFDDEADREGALRVAAALIDGRLRATGPATFLPEVAGVLVRAIRARRLARESAEAILAALVNVAIDEAEPHGFAKAAMSISLAYGLHVQDACYLETARRIGATLITGDHAQFQAAVAAGIDAIPVNEVADFGG
jgi:predicted nucleic acid-binding protein